MKVRPSRFGRAWNARTRLYWKLTTFKPKMITMSHPHESCRGADSNRHERGALTHSATRAPATPQARAPSSGATGFRDAVSVGPARPPGHIYDQQYGCRVRRCVPAACFGQPSRPGSDPGHRPTRQAAGLIARVPPLRPGKVACVDADASCLKVTDPAPPDPFRAVPSSGARRDITERCRVGHQGDRPGLPRHRVSNPVSQATPNGVVPGRHRARTSRPFAWSSGCAPPSVSESKDGLPPPRTGLPCMSRAGVEPASRGYEPRGLPLPHREHGIPPRLPWLSRTRGTGPRP